MLARFIRASVAASALLPAETAAHAFRERYDLPLPLGYWLVAAGLTVALTPAVFAFALRRAAAGGPYPTFPLARLHRFALAAMRATAAFVLFSLVAIGLLGSQDPFRNFLPAFVWVAWWIGFTYLCAVFGDLWALLNPWAIVNPRGRFGLPPALGAWPAVALLLAFAWIEIAWHGNAVPASLAWLAIAYSAITWAGMFLFGRAPWLKCGEVFTVYFGFIARLAPIEWRNHREACLRPPAAGLFEARPLSTSEACFVIVMLAVVTFDGLRETPIWAASDAHWTARTTAGLLAMPVIFALVIYGVCASMGRASPGELVRLLVPTLLPIAFAYHVAHYLSYLLIAGQAVIPLASDPLGRGWDLFGTAHYRIAPEIVGARFAWYTAVLVIVAGHVLAMYLAHRRVLERFAESRAARPRQYPFAALMVAYTMVSLWILAQPIVVR